MPAPGGPLAFDLRGTAEGVNLRNLPAAAGAPNLADETVGLRLSRYRRRGDRFAGTATLERVHGRGRDYCATGTSVEFAGTPVTITYSARGGVANLDLDRIGDALNVEALAKPAYDSRINGSFDVSGSLPRTPHAAARGVEATPPSTMSTMKLDASGTLTDSIVMGGRLPDLSC